MFVRKPAYKDFAEKLEIDERRLKNLCNNYYCMWLLREIYCHTDAAPDIKKSILSLWDDLSTTNIKAYSGIDFLLLYHPRVIGDWLRFYHQQLFSKSKFYKINK